MRLLRRISCARNISRIGLRVVKEESGSMFLHRRTTAAAAVAVTLLMVASGTLFAAKSAKVKVTKVARYVYGRPKVAVPGSIIKGSTIATGRAFFKPTMPEDTLASIKLGREAKEVLARWGNPTRITVGNGGGDSSTVDTTAPVGANPYAGANTYTGATTTGGVNPYAASTIVAPAMVDPYGNSLPVLPNAGGAMPQNPNPGGGTTISLSEDEVTWTYDLNGGISLEFVITDGLVTQITVGGNGPWKLSRTRTGLQLGDTYKLALWVCGYPESQVYVGRFLRVSYVNKSRALYTFLNKKLVGVTIAMVPTDLSL